MKYRLKPSTASVFFIRYGGQQIGSVTKRGGCNEWVARIGQLTAYGPTAALAFNDIVAIRNRIDLCGEDNREKAQAEIARRNAELLKQTREFNDLLGFPLMRVKRGRRFPI